MENNYKVYIHEFPNNKVYIGITCQNVNDRWRNRYRGCPFMYNAIKKYGWKNIEHKVLFENLTKEEAEQKEIELIAQYKSNQRKYGYNIANGGNHSGKHSFETINKIKNSVASKTFRFKKGNTPWNKGVPQNEDAKEKNRIAHLGKKQKPETIEKRIESLKGHIVSDETKRKMQETKSKHFPNGFKHSEETREKLRQYNLGKKQSKETIEKRSITFKEKYKNGYVSPLKGVKAVNRIPIVQLDLNNNYIREWDCIKDAANYYNITASRICLVLKGKRKYTVGYKWIYKNEYMVSNTILGI